VGSLKLLKETREYANAQRCSNGNGVARGTNKEIETGDPLHFKASRLDAAALNAMHRSPDVMRIYREKACAFQTVMRKRGEMPAYRSPGRQ